MRYGSLLVAVAAAALAGCGSPKVYPVKGRITFEGKSMKGGGSISFMPIGNQPGKAGGGEIKEDGTYELTTYQSGDGSMAGEFRVVIYQSTEREPDATKDGERGGRSVSVVAEGERIPTVYADPTRSPLTAKVETRENTIDLDLRRGASGSEPNAR